MYTYNNSQPSNFSIFYLTAFEEVDGAGDEDGILAGAGSSEEDGTVRLTDEDPAQSESCC